MVQYIQPASIFGRVGSGIGKGFGEQLPKEIERGRLASGLEQLSQQSGQMTPLQQFTKLAPLPGVTPQMLQTFGDLARQQSMRQSYRQKAGMGGGGPQQQMQQPGTVQDVRFANLPQQQARAIQPQGDQVAPGEFGQPQIAPQNPLRQEATPAIPWTQQRRDQQIAENFEQNPYLTRAENLEMVREQEQRELASPQAQQARDAYFENITNKANDSFQKQLETKLQKQGADIYGDITGENLVNLQRGMSRDLRINPNASIQDVANKWSNFALGLAKTKGILNQLSANTGLSSFFKGDENYQKLKSASKVFEKTRNSEEFYNRLQSGDQPAVYDKDGNLTKPAIKGFGMSPQGAASIAFPLSKNIKEYVAKSPSSTGFDVLSPRSASNERKGIELSRKHAIEIENMLTHKDSLLSIAYNLKQKDPFFSQNAFFNQLREDKDDIGLNDRQENELIVGEQYLPTWGDVKILPFFRGGKRYE